MDARQYAPATERNREPILKVLSRVLPPQGNILELASGTGEHAVFFAPRLLPCQWYPSDPNPLLRDSIEAWRNYQSVDNLLSPLNIDVCESQWQVEKLKIEINAIVNINMLHISPWQACLGLMAGSNRILPSGGVLYLYGPYKQNGQHTAESNRSFDESLRRQNPDWGVRDLEDVMRIAKSEALEVQEIVVMPANNLSVVFQKS